MSKIQKIEEKEVTPLVKIATHKALKESWKLLAEEYDFNHTGSLRTLAFLFCDLLQYEVGSPDGASFSEIIAIIASLKFRIHRTLYNHDSNWNKYD